MSQPSILWWQKYGTLAQAAVAEVGRHCSGLQVEKDLSL
jgi:hypothetical protein